MKRSGRYMSGVAGLLFSSVDVFVLFIQDFNISEEPTQDDFGGGGGGRGGIGRGEGVRGGEGDGGLEEWEDDGWGMLESRETAVASSGADFFDTFQSSVAVKEKEEDLFERLGVGVSGKGARGDRPSPPPVSASLFGGSGGGGGGGIEEVAEEEPGWGDWGDGFSSKKQVSQRVRPQELPQGLCLRQ